MSMVTRSIDEPDVYSPRGALGFDVGRFRAPQPTRHLNKPHHHRQGLLHHLAP